MSAVISSALLANSNKAGAIFKAFPSALLSSCSSHLTQILSRGVPATTNSSAQSQSSEASSSFARLIKFCVSGFLTSLPVGYCLTRNPKAVGEVFLCYAGFFPFNVDVVSEAQIYHLLTLLLYIFWADLPTNPSLLLRNLKLPLPAKNGVPKPLPNQINTHLSSTESTRSDRYSCAATLWDGY